MVICNFYSHKTGFERIVRLVRQNFPKSNVKTSKEGGSEVAEISLSGGFLKAASKLRISYRQRLEPSYQLKENAACPLTTNLVGLYGYVSGIPAKNEKVKGQLLNKVQTLNSEFSLIQESGTTKGLEKLIALIATEFKAVIFAQPLTVIAKSTHQHFLDERLNLVLDVHGNSEVKDLRVEVDPHYANDLSNERFKIEKEDTPDEMPDFRAMNAAICFSEGFKPASSLPVNWHRQLRPSIEIALRLNAIKAMVLWLMVPQDSLPNEKLLAFVSDNQLRNFMTEDEKRIFISSRDDENLRNSIGWKFENAWSLAWYFGFTEPEIFGTMMSGDLMSEILRNHSCPLNESVSDWVVKQETRTESEVIAKEDLFYCLHNAARSAQMGGKTVPEGFDPIGGGGVIHERRHALTWMLSNGIDWEDTDLST